MNDYLNKLQAELLLKWPNLENRVETYADTALVVLTYALYQKPYWVINARNSGTSVSIKLYRFLTKEEYENQVPENDGLVAQYWLTPNSDPHGVPGVSTNPVQNIKFGEFDGVGFPENMDLTVKQLVDRIQSDLENYRPPVS